LDWGTVPQGAAAEQGRLAGDWYVQGSRPRVWSSIGTAGILGVRACGHAARIRVRQHGGGGHGGAGASSSAPTLCVTGDKAEREKEMGKGMTDGPHM
jgi:hypothetical protein